MIQIMTICCAQFAKKAILLIKEDCKYTFITNMVQKKDVKRNMDPEDLSQPLLLLFADGNLMVSNAYCSLDTVQDFLINLGIKPHMYASMENKHFITK